MARTLIFIAEFTKSKVKTTPANAPTIDIADMLAPTSSLLVSGGSPTQLTNMTGVYIYSYSAADSVLPVGLMRTADTTVDLQDVPCLPLAFDSNGLLKSSLYGILGTLLTETLGGYLAAAFKKLFDVVTPVLTAASVNQTGDAYARIGANGAGLTALGDTRLANLDAAVSTRSTLAAGAQMDLVDAPNATARTAIATSVWALGTRTLTGFGTLIADIWAYAQRTLTQGAASVNAAVQGTSLTQYRGATWTITLTGLGALTGYSKIYFAIKDDKVDADADALLLIEKSAGLTRLNGGAYATAADGAMVIDSEPAGNLTLTVKPAATAQLEPRGGLHYGVKLVRTDGTVSQLSDGTGKFNIAADVPRAIS